jgi:hypothetical protein
MNSKSYFEQFKKEIEEEHKAHDTVQISTDLLTGSKCDHKGKAKIKDGVLVCTCGAGWSGPQIEKLLELFNKS